MQKAIVLALVALLCAGCVKKEVDLPVQKIDGLKTYIWGASVVIDPGTGCQYLLINERGGLTPRMGADGKQVCRNVPNPQKD